MAQTGDDNLVVNYLVALLQWSITILKWRKANKHRVLARFNSSFNQVWYRVYIE